MANDPIQVALKPPMGTTGWQMKVGTGGWTTGPQYAPITVGYNHKADITFTIDNSSSPNVTFAANPILLPAKDKVFDPPTMNSPTSFTITDKNPDVDHQIPYALVFNHAPKLDPIIDNDGGGHIFLSDAIIDVLGGALLGALLVLILRPLFRRRGPVERQRPD